MSRSLRSRMLIGNMWKERGDSARRVRIEIPRLEVLPGSFVAVIGANGSGKSTLLDIMGLILSADHADQFLFDFGQPVNLCRLTAKDRIRLRREHLSYVLQTGGLLEFLTIRDNIALAARLRGKSLAKVDQVADRVGIGEIMDKLPGKISGGQRQKAALARALVQESALILADEPTAALDEESSKELMRIFRSLVDETGSSLIMVTHDRSLIEQCADAAYRFEARTVAKGLLSSALHPFLFPSAVADA